MNTESTKDASKNCHPPLVRKVLNSFAIYYGVTSQDEVEATEVPGYWRFRKVCHGECQMGHDHPMQHTLSYTEHGERDERGRWIDPYRAWKEWRQFFSQNL